MPRSVLLPWLAIALVWAAVAAPGAADDAEPWVRHATFEQFSAGSFADGGSNLYARRNGGVEMIHRWDYNNDGFLDLLASNDHNLLENEDAFIYWGRPQGLRSLMPDVPAQQPLGRFLHQLKVREKGVTRLPSDGGGRAIVVDLDHDGRPEIVFCNTIHNYSVFTTALIYWGTEEGYGIGRRTALPTLMASGVAAADFNRDGFTDLVFANQGIEEPERFGLDHHLESYLYWGGPTGFTEAGRTSIPSVSAVTCAAADLNQDGYPELLLVNNNTHEKSWYLYWGGAAGFSEERREVRRGGDPVGARFADLDSDGHADLVVTHRDSRAEIFRGTGQGLAPIPTAVLPTLGASQTQTADLNRDGHADLVFAGEGTATQNASLIYWGGAAGFAADRRTVLPTLHATDVALADFNGDGWTDVAFANEHDGQTYDVNSYVYWNGPQGFDDAARLDLQGFGAVSVQAADLDGDARPELVLINRNSGRLTGIDTFIYWGNAAHHYSPAAMTSVLGARGVTPSVADFDQDGYVDLVVATGLLYFGGADGYTAQRRVDLRYQDGLGTAVGDFNQDGYLDLAIVGGIRETARAAFFWGGPGGLAADRKTEIKLNIRMGLSVSAADLNRDGYLDAIFCDLDTTLTEVLWGGPGGFQSERRSALTVQPSTTVELADLDGDGWLDLIFGGGYDPKTPGRSTRVATIGYGGPGAKDGYAVVRQQRLEAFQSLEQAVADFNRDGYLDIAMTNYHAGFTRTLPSFVYWGGPQGYSETRRLSLPGESTGAITAADFNRDGWPDLFVIDHVARGDHGADGNLFWGGPAGFAYARRQTVPTFGTHFSTRRDVGNLYTRALSEEYLSPPLAIPAGRQVSSLAWQAQQPHGTRVAFQIRSATTAKELAGAAWQGPGGPRTTYEQPGAVRLPVGHAWLQYQAILSTPDGGSTPRLEQVELRLHP